jgi:hypothetical protein
VDRYRHKPFLRLLECYVLKAIGELDTQQEQVLERMAPKLSVLYGEVGSWLEIVRLQMDFSANLPWQIRDVWDRTLSQAALKGVVVDPIEFATNFVDENFSGCERERPSSASGS